MIVSRSNSLTMSAACHVSTFKEVYSSSTRSMSVARDENTLDDIAETVGDGDDWGRRAVAAISATVEEGYELQPLIPESLDQTAASGCYTIQSERGNSGGLAENISSVETGTSSNFADLERGNRVVWKQGRDSEGHPLLSLRSDRRGMINDDSDLGRDSTPVLGDRSVYAGRAIMFEGDTDTESEHLVASSHANSDHSRRTAGSLDADDTEDRLQAACRLEDGSVSEEEDMRFRILLSRSRIRWGVVLMPDEFYTQFGDREDGMKLGHLTFGIEEQGVAPPEDDPGHVYI